MEINLGGQIFAMKKNLIILLLIFLLALILRTYKFGQIPSSLNWDEIAIGWNASSIWEAKIDQYGTRWPLSFKSYGDYKSPLYIYGLAPLVGLMGKKAWVVRLPSLIVGLLSILITYCLGKEIAKHLKLTQKQSEIFALFSIFFLAITPWNIIYSRAAYEANLAFFFILTGTWLFLKSLNKPILWILSGLCFILSLYSYHSPKIVVPLLLLTLVICFKKELSNQLKSKNWFLILYLLILPYIYIFP